MEDEKGERGRGGKRRVKENVHGIRVERMREGKSKRREEGLERGYGGPYDMDYIMCGM